MQGNSKDEDKGYRNTLPFLSCWKSILKLSGSIIFLL